MTDSTAYNDSLRIKAKALAKDGKTITQISKELNISWNKVRGYTPGWRGTKVKLTNRLNKLISEPDEGKRRALAADADRYADFLYDAAKHLRDQVDGARKALNR